MLTGTGNAWPKEKDKMFITSRALLSKIFAWLWDFDVLCPFLGSGPERFHTGRLPGLHVQQLPTLSKGERQREQEGDGMTKKGSKLWSSWSSIADILALY